MAQDTREGRRVPFTLKNIVNWPVPSMVAAVAAAVSVSLIVTRATCRKPILREVVMGAAALSPLHF